MKFAQLTTATHTPLIPIPRARIHIRKQSFDNTSALEFSDASVRNLVHCDQLSTKDGRLHVWFWVIRIFLSLCYYRCLRRFSETTDKQPNEQSSHIWVWVGLTGARRNSLRVKVHPGICRPDVGPFSGFDEEYSFHRYSNKFPQLQILYFFHFFFFLGIRDGWLGSEGLEPVCSLQTRATPSDNSGKPYISNANDGQAPPALKQQISFCLFADQDEGLPTVLVCHLSFPPGLQPGS